MKLIVATSTVSDGSMFRRDDPSHLDIIKNRKKFLELHDISMDQTTRLKISYDTNDFCRYGEVTATNKSEGMYDGHTLPYDALVTTQPNHALFLSVADCIAATFYDPVHHVLGLAHLGRHSLEQHGGQKFVNYLKDHYHCAPKNITVWLGPAPAKDAYPIWMLNNKGMKEAILGQLHDAGILDIHIINNPAETNQDLDYFSYSEFLKGNRINNGSHAMVTMMRS